MAEPLVYTVEEAAKLLAIGRTAAYAAARTGELPAVRIGRSLRVPRRALEQMLTDDERRAHEPGVVKEPTRQGLAK